jgi:hypothetical protein
LLGRAPEDASIRTVKRPSAAWYRSLPGWFWIARRFTGEPAARGVSTLRAPAASPKPTGKVAGVRQPTRPRYRLVVICAWCGKGLGVRPASPVTAGAVSHGLCPRCARRLERS